MRTETKVLEVRDHGTHIPVLAVRMRANNDLEGYYLHYRCGYPTDGSGIVVMQLHTQKASVDAYDWGDRTMNTAHLYINLNFDKLNDGDVVDVSFILKETQMPKPSERLTDSWYRGRGNNE